MLKILTVILFVLFCFTNAQTDEECSQIADQEIRNKAINAQTTMDRCIASYISMETFITQVRENRFNGNLRNVMKKYCRNTPPIKTCFDDFLEDYKPCIQDSGMAAGTEEINTMKRLVDFVCMQKGAKLAMFFASDAPECFQKSGPQYGECFLNFTRTFENVESYDAMANKYTISNMKFLMTSPVTTCSHLDTLLDCVGEVFSSSTCQTAKDYVTDMLRYVSKCPVPKSTE